MFSIAIFLQLSENALANMHLKGVRSRSLPELKNKSLKTLGDNIDEDKEKKAMAFDRGVGKGSSIDEATASEAKVPSMFSPAFPAPASQPASAPDSDTAAAVIGGTGKDKNKADKGLKDKDGILPFKKMKKAKKFKDQTDDTIFGKKIKKGLGNKKSKIKKAKSHKKSKPKAKWKGGSITYIVPWRITDPNTGAAVDSTRKIKCPANSTELFMVEENPTDEFGNYIHPDDDPNHGHDVLCHHAALGLNFSEPIDHALFHLLAPSMQPSISHAPSTSMSPSLSPSVSFEPTTSHAPTKVHKGMTCRERPTSEPSVINSVPSNATRRLNGTETNTTEIEEEVVMEPEIPEEDLLAIAGGWNPDGPNEKPKFWYELPFCDTVPSISPAPSLSFLPSVTPTISLVPSISLIPSHSLIPSIAPSMEGYKGPLVGMGCEMAADGVEVVAVGDDVPVEFLYEVVTNVPNISESGVLKYIEEQMHGIVTPALLECDVGNTTRRLQTSSGVQFLVPAPEDLLVEDDICKGGMAVGPDETCYRVKSRMTAIVEEGFPFVADSINIEVMGAARDGLNDGSYINFDEGVIDTRFIGIDESQTLIETPAGASSQSIIVEPEKLTSLGGTFIGLAVIGFIVVVLLALRKRRSTDVVIMEELEDDDELYKNDDLKDSKTVITSMSSPMSNISHDLDASPSDYVNVLGGNNQDSSIVDELRRSANEHQNIFSNGALHSPYGSDGNQSNNLTRDVHQCTSAMCEICKPWKNYDPTFIPTRTPTNKASPKAKAPRSDYKLERKRAYKTEDTVVL